MSEARRGDPEVIGSNEAPGIAEPAGNPPVLDCRLFIDRKEHVPPADASQNGMQVRDVAEIVAERVS